MTVRQLIETLVLLMVDEAEVYIESEDRRESTIGRVIVDLDGDVIIEFEREVNDARTN